MRDHSWGALRAPRRAPRGNCNFSFPRRSNHYRNPAATSHGAIMSRELERLRDLFLQRVDKEKRNVPAPLSPWNTPFSSAFNFRYSYTEISAQGDGAHVKRRETRFENGRLVNEECEGEIDRASYERAVQQSQQLFFDQMQQMMRLCFAPFGIGYRRDE
jgi:hypothetical protein